MMMMVMMMIFIYCNLVFTRSVELYKNRRERARKEKQYTKQYKNTEFTKQKTNIRNKKQTKNIKNNISRVIRK
jgi:hypothetical protein